MSARSVTPAAGAWRALDLLLAASTGVLIFLSFPNWNLHLLCWFGLVPLLLAARDAGPKRGFWLGLLAGTVTNAGGFHWMTEMLREFGHLPVPVTWAILGLQAVTQGLAMALGVGLWRWLVQRGAPVGVSAFLALWLGEATVPMIFPWFLGNGISPERTLIQIADLGGVHLVSGVLYAANAALAEPILAFFANRRPSWRLLGATALAVAASFAYGTVRIPQVEAEEAAAPKVRIGMVEGNVGIWEKEARHLDAAARSRTLRHNLLKHQQLSAKLEKQGAELIVWPESAYQPFGTNPVLHTTDRFLLVGEAGAILRHDGKRLAAEPPDRLGMPRDVGLLTGLSSPRGDVWRAIDRGRRVLTVTPRGTHVADLPAGETAIATVATPVDLFGRLEPGLVVARSGRVWRLGLPDLGEKRDAKQPPPPAPTLVEFARPDPGQAGAGPIDVTAATRNGAGLVVLVGRGGAIRLLGDHGFLATTSPVSADLWTVAADPSGALILAAGAGGTVVQGDGDRWVSAQLGAADLYAAWFAPDGTAWLAGQGGAVYERKPGQKWSQLPAFTEADVLAGAADADGHVLAVARGGRLFSKAPGGKFTALAGGTRGEITAVHGFQAQASYLIPRSTKRILPSRAPLPDPNLPFPADVAADVDVGEFDRSTPRRGFRAPLLFGALSHGGALPSKNAGCADCYNSALLMDGDGKVLALHDKAFLLMFGEYIPFGEEFPQLYDLSPETSRFQPGTRTAPVELSLSGGRKARMGMLICYEDLVPRFARRIAAHDPNVFVNLTNDAWFGKTAEPEHHLNLALMRTVEYRRWLLRSTNTGISVFIDATGRRVVETSLDGAETLLRDVPLLEGRTVYASLGDWPLLLLVAGVCLTLARALRGGRPPSASKAAGDKPKNARKPAEPKASRGKTAR